MPVSLSNSVGSASVLHPGASRPSLGLVSRQRCRTLNHCWNQLLLENYNGSAAPGFLESQDWAGIYSVLEHSLEICPPALALCSFQWLSGSRGQSPEGLLDIILYLVNRGCTRRAPESHKNNSVKKMRQFVDTCNCSAWRMQELSCEFLCVGVLRLPQQITTNLVAQSGTHFCSCCSAYQMSEVGHTELKSGH